MKGIKTKAILERTLYLDLPDDTSDEEVLKQAKSEIIPPIDAFYTAAQALKSLHINIPKLDLKDWSMSDIEYEIVK